MKIKLVISLLFLLSPVLAGAQDLNQLRSDRERSLNEISQTEELLKQTESNRKSEVNNLRLLNKQISAREKVVRSINGEINLLSNQIKTNEGTVNSLTEEIRLLKEDYGRVIYKTYLNRNAYHRAQYIFAASDFNQAFKRLKYMQQYAKFRKNQAELIEVKTRELKQEISNLETNKLTKNELLTTGKREVATLNNDKRQRETYVRDLQRQEKKLKKDLESQRALYKKLENEISRIIAAATGSEVSASGMKLTPEMKIISSEFSQNIGRFPWPVSKGVITMGYGLQNYPGLRNGQIDNKGIDITTESSAPVLAIFEGKVKSVVAITANLKAVLIQHGEYFTVYSNLSSVKVRVGDDVKIKQEIGTVGQNSSGSFDVHFEIWKERTNLNPEKWLAR